MERMGCKTPKSAEHCVPCGDDGTAAFKPGDEDGNNSEVCVCDFPFYPIFTSIDHQCFSDNFVSKSCFDNQFCSSQYFS